MVYRAFKVLSCTECSSVVKYSNSIFLKNVFAHTYRSFGVVMHLFCRIDRKASLFTVPLFLLHAPFLREVEKQIVLIQFDEFIEARKRFWGQSQMEFFRHFTWKGCVRRSRRYSKMTCFPILFTE